MKGFRIISFFSLLLFLSTGIHAFQWPIADPIVTATFGESRWDHFHSGIDLGGGIQEVYPIEKGEIIFTYEEGDVMDSIPTGLGTFVVVEHERGIRSTYAHLDAAYEGPHRIGTQDVIGITGETGASLGRHLHFDVVDSELKRLVNPLLLLPPVRDDSEPVLGQIGFFRDGERLNLAEKAEIDDGPVELIIDAYDISERASYFLPLAPYGILVFLNGDEVFSLTFEALEESASSLVVTNFDSKPFRSLYLSDWEFNIGSLLLKEGEVSLEVVVFDYIGNETSRTLIFEVVS